MNSQEKNSINVNNVVDRLKSEEGIENDRDFAKKIGMKPSTLSMARKRNSIDLNLIFNYFGNYSKDWIIDGIGPKLVEEKLHNIVREPEVDYNPSEMMSKIKGLDISADEKLDLLKTYIEVLEQAKMEKKK